ncbi:methylenetetrahydrofolate reductase (NADPH) [Natronocella acetinitrilica]|uniref:Methylenetetrahydrofolate reductase (NADPH) n=1 Tax=Natronocella acetinitrilica TaxID=414046 RepID=A0AAE3KA91_9GAMM|nr:hypothetical protein [Natronocella acetinitrilica]MCP1673234.1 methylenetetrahydrofolate reductase (NADPH) [Natronocella acetinitrilica]
MPATRVAGVREAGPGCLALAAPRYEVLPVSGVVDRCRALPSGATVTVTCSPRHGIEHTLETAVELRRLDLRVVPHVAARLLKSRGHLDDVLGRLTAEELDEVFLVGGDSPQPQGPYASGLEVLETLDSLSQRPRLIGVPAYPEGHGIIDAGRLRASLAAKAAVAHYAVTQLCFDAGVILDWLTAQRRDGFSLPVYLGVAGRVDPARLMRIGMRIGLGPSMRLLRRQGGLVGRLLGANRRRQDALLEALAAAVDQPALNIAGIHVYTFNEVDASRACLESLRRKHCRDSCQPDSRRRSAAAAMTITS